MALEVLHPSTFDTTTVLFEDIESFPPVEGDSTSDKARKNIRNRLRDPLARAAMQGFGRDGLVFRADNKRCVGVTFEAFQNIVQYARVKVRDRDENGQIVTAASLGLKMKEDGRWPRDIHANSINLLKAMELEWAGAQNLDLILAADPSHEQVTH